MNRNCNKLILPLLLIFLMIAGGAFAKDLVVKEPPKSMDKLYPPESKEMKWVQQMHKMSGNMGGVFIDMKEEDWENVDKHAEAFFEAYKETSKMIPEWKDYFDVDAAQAFLKAVKTHDPAQIGKAAKGVGKTCGKCHHEQYVSVWTRYHWPKVENIKITDPVDEKEMGYGKYMHLISNTFKEVTVNFGEGQYDRAAKSARALEKRYTELKSTCSKCHVTDDVKLFFVNDKTIGAIAAMRKELDADKPDPGAFWKNVGTLGKDGCKKCHLTHRAYAIIQEVWEEE
ncbi:MAG: hypothetical protein KC553_04935 [Nitrospina sp.]|nr:hypothetical protein [Nitrospina sp.]